MDHFNIRKFRIEIFFGAFLVILFLTIFSFLAAWGRDEGTLEANDGFILNFLADSFSFFRLPTHGLFWAWILEKTYTRFMTTLFVNIVFWALVSERIIAGILSLKSAKSLKNHGRQQKV